MLPKPLSVPCASVTSLVSGTARSLIVGGRFGALVFVRTDRTFIVSCFVAVTVSCFVAVTVSCFVASIAISRTAADFVMLGFVAMYTTVIWTTSV